MQEVRGRDVKGEEERRREAKREMRGEGRRMGRREKGGEGKGRKGRNRRKWEEKGGGGGRVGGVRGCGEGEGSLITFSAPPVPAPRSRVTGRQGEPEGKHDINNQMVEPFSLPGSQILPSRGAGGGNGLYSLYTTYFSKMRLFLN